MDERGPDHSWKQPIKIEQLDTYRAVSEQHGIKVEVLATAGANFTFDCVDTNGNYFHLLRRVPDGQLVIELTGESEVAEGVAAARYIVPEKFLKKFWEDLEKKLKGPFHL